MIINMKKNILILLIFVSASTLFGQNTMKYKLTPQKPEYLETAPNKLIHTEVINASLDDLWDAVSKCSNWVEWFPKMSSCEVKGKGQIDDNRQVQIDKMQFYQKIIILEEKKGFGFTILGTNKKLFRSAVEAVFLEPVDENTTKIIYKAGVDYAGLARWFKGFADKKLLQTWEAAFTSLRTFIEPTD